MKAPRLLIFLLAFLISGCTESEFKISAIAILAAFALAMLGIVREFLKHLKNS